VLTTNTPPFLGMAFAEASLYADTKLGADLGDVDFMSDVVVHVAVNDDQAESKFLATIDQFARLRDENSGNAGGSEAPVIMTKTILRGANHRKAVIFQDRQSAAEFLNLWRRAQQSA